MRNKQFRHIGTTLDSAHVVRDNSSGVRKYFYNGSDPKFVGHNAVSITTMLSSFEKPEIKKWRQAVGEEEALRQMGIAARQGAALHACAEAYLKNEENFPEGTMPNVIDLFRRIQPALDDIDDIVCQEMPLFGRYSITNQFAKTKHHYLAGTVDCIARYKGRPAVIDFKTATGFKTEDMIKDYYIQCTAYALMYFCMTNVSVKDIVVIIASEESSDAQVFVQPANKGLILLGNMLEAFYEREEKK
jgi:hypothetical protein